MYPRTTQSIANIQKNHLYMGRNRDDRTGDRSSHGRTNNTAIAPNIASTPASFASKIIKPSHSVVQPPIKLSGTARRIA